MTEQLITEEQHNQLDEPSRMRPLLGRAALVVGSGILGAGAGLGYAIATPASVTIGGMEARVELTQGQTSEVDLGLMGSAIIPESTTVLGADIGAKVTIDGLHNERSTEALGDNTINSFLQLFSDPEYELSNVSTAIRQHLARGVFFGGSGGAGLGAIGLGAAYLARRRMDVERQIAFDTAFAMSGRTKALAASLAGLSVLGSGITWTVHEMPATPRRELAASPVFNNTPLEGAELTGLLKPAVGTLAPAIEKYIKDNDAFYDTVNKNFELAFNDTIGTVETNSSETLFITASDRHCNTGMDRVIAQVAELYGARTYLTAGDDNMSGTVAIESACTAGVAQRLSRQHVTLVAVRGNHDSKQTEKDETSQGYKVLDGNKIISVNGLNIIGDGDPRRSAFGHTITPDGAEAERVLKKQSMAFMEKSCKHEVDIALIHEPASAEDVIQSGCVPLTVTGHTHVWKAPKAIGSQNPATYHFSEGTTGGAKENSLTLGPLKTDATVTVFKFNTHDKTFQYSKITVTPEAGVMVSEFEAPSGSLKTVQPSPSASTIKPRDP